MYSDEIENLNKSIYETLKAKKIITCVSVNILEKKKGRKLKFFLHLSYAGQGSNLNIACPKMEIKTLG